MKAKANRHRGREHELDEIESLIQDCGGENCFEQQDARLALERIGEEAVEPLIHALLNDETSTVRWRAAEALGHISDLRAIEPLIRALKDESSSVQWRAIEALVDIGEPATRQLKAALADDNQDVRLGATRALKEISIRIELGSKEALYDNIGMRLTMHRA